MGSVPSSLNGWLPETFVEVCSPQPETASDKTLGCVFPYSVTVLFVGHTAYKMYCVGMWVKKAFPITENLHIATTSQSAAYRVKC